MRARLGLAAALQRTGAVPEALEHYRALLELNPNDNQGVRYLFASALLSSKDDGELRELLRRYGDDEGSAMAYARALIAFRHGDEEAAELVGIAYRANAHVPALLLGDRPLLVPDDGYLTMGGLDEAAWYVRENGEAWRRADGAVAWLLATAPAARKRRR